MKGLKKKNFVLFMNPQSEFIGKFNVIVSPKHAL